MFELMTSASVKEQSIKDSLGLLFSKYQEDKKEIEDLANFMKTNGALGHFSKGNKVNGFYGESLFKVEGALKSLDSEYWFKVFKMTGVIDILPAEKRVQWNDLISEMNTPGFEEKIVLATLEQMLSNSHNFIAEKVYGVYKKTLPQSQNQYRFWIFREVNH